MPSRSTIPARQDIGDDTPLRLDVAEVMARVCYDFEHPRFPHRIIGAVEHRTLSQARSVCAELIEMYGEGSHWVEPLNWTWEERLVERSR